MSQFSSADGAVLVGAPPPSASARRPVPTRARRHPRRGTEGFDTRDQPRRTGLPARWFVVALACAAILVLSLPTAALAGDHRYCSSLVSPHTACSTTTTGVYYENVATYPGSGTVAVCVHDYFNGGTIDRTCANNVSNDYPILDTYYSQGIPTELTAGNDSGFAHTIYGDGLY
jgi:hypothetical protein